ncbi:MAG: putative thiamine transport system permease protein [Paracoccaceae bacterium]|jgi:putative thiamine transport system permease protein
MPAFGPVGVKRRLRFAWLPYLTLAAMLGPVLAGLAGTIAPAFGYLPAAGQSDWGLDAFRTLVEWPGFSRAAGVSVSTGFLATGLSLLIVVLITAGWQGRAAFVVLQRLLSPLLAVPHAAAAFGLAFLIAPSGWLVRLVSPWATGWEQPPDVLIVQDAFGLALVAGLVAKEVPFLLLMTLSALPQVDGHRSAAVAGALGYGRVTGWIKAVFPRVYAQIRLPVYVVLAYSMSVVDVAVILGPNTPPTLSVQIVRWMNDPDIALRLQAAAAALVQCALVLGACGVWRLGESLVARLGHIWIMRGGRGMCEGTLQAFGLIAGVASALAVVLGLAGLAVWSLAGFWSYPDLLPDTLTWRSWIRHAPGLWDAARETLIVAFVATAVALVLTLGCLEAEHRFGLRLGPGGVFLLYVPLLVPQTAFLPGLQTLMLSAGFEVGRGPVILAHLVFVLPYVFLSLGDPFRAWDTRFGTIASALGAGPDRVLWAVRLPMLLAPLLTAFAVGFAVSVGQYLPTLLVGGGRVATLTTEAVSLAAGGDRRAIGVFGLMQTVAAFVPFLIAVVVPPLVWRHKGGMRNG